MSKFYPIMKRLAIVELLLGMLSFCASSQPRSTTSIDISTQFTASGLMGDGEQGDRFVTMVEGSRENPHSAPMCFKVVYRLGPKGFAGCYWQNEPDNWGDHPGADLRRYNFTRLTFWAKGRRGGEIVEFKTGGINSPGKPYRDSFRTPSEKIALDTTWRQYTINLNGQNLTSVIGGFCWIASRSANPDGLVFYLDDIRFEQ